MVKNAQPDYRRGLKRLSSLPLRCVVGWFWFFSQMTLSIPGICSLGHETPVLTKTRTGPVRPVRASYARLNGQAQNINLRANCICLDDPESPVGNRVLVITPNVVLPTCAVRPG
jgi:hypothetical protein